MWQSTLARETDGPSRTVQFIVHSDASTAGALMAATIVIVTRNRCEDVLRAVRSAVVQEYAPLEVVVYDDASTDRTTELIRREFPDVHVTRNEEQVGYIVLRNRGFREGVGDVVFSIDDDAYFTNPDTVGRTMGLFAKHSRVAAVALPYVEPSTSGRGRVMTGVLSSSQIRGYVGCAHAIRRSVALELGGYREFFVHQGEERDLAIRMRNAGYQIIYGDTPPIVHTYSPKRDHEALSFYGFRNTLLFDILNVPQPYAAGRFAIDAFNLLRYKLSVRTLPSRIGYLLRSLGDCAKYLRLRDPVSRACYREHRALPSHGPTRAAEHSGDELESMSFAPSLRSTP